MKEHNKLVSPSGEELHSEQSVIPPGINDTTTAIMCIDYLTAIMARIAPRQIPSSRRYEEGELRVFAKGPTFEILLAESFDQIRSNAKGDVAIMSRLCSGSNSTYR